MRSRDAVMRQLEAGDVPEVLIVGGGINGVGVYRDLAAQGVAALLVDRGDFSSGTSAAPSRLIHGGLRYLETGEFALVRESVEERNLLLLNAPHVVRPIRCWIPLQSWFGGALATVLRFLRLTRTPGPKGAVPIRVGLAFYDLFGNAHRTMPRSRFHSRAAARARIPGLAAATRAVAEYFDARISHPERLVAELVADAEADCPASLAVPYCAAAGLDEDGAVVLSDRIGGGRIRVRPTIVVNAAGAWLDGVHGALGLTERLVGGTKGSHLIVRRPDLAAELGDVMLYFETADHRACLIYRFDADHVLLGTTDLRTDDADDMTCSPAEIDYLFAVLAAVMPGAPLRRDEIVFRYAGVRPLPRTADGVTGAISRDHALRRFDPAPGRPFTLISLVGGKWTTYRACAAEIADAVLARLGRPRRLSTKTLPIGGGRGFPKDEAGRAAFVADLSGRTGLSPARCALLADRYGAGAAAIAAAEAADGRLLSSMPAYSVAEIVAIAATERVSRLEDVVLRRTLMAFEGAVNRAGLEELADLVAPVLGWSAERRAAETDECARLLRERHGVSVDAATASAA